MQHQDLKQHLCADYIHKFDDSEYCNYIISDGFIYCNKKQGNNIDTFSKYDMQGNLLYYKDNITLYEKRQEFYDNGAIKHYKDTMGEAWYDTKGNETKRIKIVG